MIWRGFRLAIARQAWPSRYRAWTTDTASVPLSPWQTPHASAPDGVVFVSACAAAAVESWQARHASCVGGVWPTTVSTPPLTSLATVGRTPEGSGSCQVVPV